MALRIPGWLKPRTKVPSRLYMVDLFVASGLITVFLIRAYLAATGYPQIGGRGLHIAHMLWGGFILCGTTLYLALAKNPRKLASLVVAGTGFGFFIDELGKFITRNNNYFFQPAAAIIIGYFIVLWLALRAVIARADKVKFIPAASWPTSKLARRLLGLWLTIEVVGSVGALIVTTIWPGVVLSNLPDTRLFVTYNLIYSLILVLAFIMYIGRQRDNAARLLRLAVIGNILFITPVNFYIEQFSATTGFIISVLIVIATSRHNYAAPRHK